MNHIRVDDEHNSFVRISKQAARKRFMSGEPVYIIAHKMRPGYPFSMGMNAFPQEWLERAAEGDNAFDKMVRSFTWYNCGHYEVGYYPAFYIETAKGTHDNGHS
jgi:hypothetical protein